MEDPYDPAENGRYRLNDASLYKGHYYLYFGIVPAVTLFVPYRLLTGRDLSDRVATPLFCIAGYLTSCALFLFLARRNHWILPLWLECALLISLASMSLVCLLLRRPSYYEVAIAAGYFFLMAGFLVLAKAISPSASSARWYLLAGTLFGLAVGCRPHLVLVCALVLGASAIRMRRNPRLVLALLSGMGICAVGLGWYNYARFGNPLEFGRSYQLTAFPSNPASTYRGVELNPDFALLSAKQFLLLLPQIDRHMPFIRAVAINPLSSWPGQPIWTEESVGLIPAAPFAVLGLLMPAFLRRRWFATQLDGPSTWLLFVMYWSSIAVFLILCLVGWMLGRYLVDFAPMWTLEGVCILAMLRQAFAQPRSKNIFAWVVGATTIYAAIVNTAFATIGLRTLLKLRLP